MVSILYIVLAVIVFIVFILYKQRKVVINFNGKEYKLIERFAKLVDRCISGDTKAQYELITEYYEDRIGFPTEICFHYVSLMAEKEVDLGILTQLGDMYYKGDGVEQDKAKAVEIYKRALYLFDNPKEDLYIPNKTAEYRHFLENTISEYSS